MMDLQQQVAARRLELAKQDQDRQAANKAAEANLVAAKLEQEAQALDAIARGLSTETVPLSAKDGELHFAEVPAPLLDVVGLSQKKIAALLNREARKRWTPGENWLVIGCITGGICLIHLGGIGLVPLAVGLWQMSAINKKYATALREDHPQIFGTLT